MNGSAPRRRAFGRGAAALLGGALLAGELLAVPTAAADPAPPPVVIGGGGAIGSITVTATSPGSPGGPGGGSASPVGSGSGGGGSLSSSGPAAPTGPTLDAYGGALCSGAGSTCSSLLGGNSLTNPTGFLNSAGQALCGLGSATACPVPGTPAVPGAPPTPPSSAIVAQTAISQLNLTAATPHLSADPNTAVGLPVWMWVDQSPRSTGPVSTTATAGATSVTAVATLAGIDWSMGPAGAVVSCAGPGTPAPAGPIFHGNNSPDCGYSYALRSLPERTGGTGKWPVTATAVWNITWFGGGQTGGQGLRLTSTTAVEVGELQAVFVAPGRGN